MVLAGREVMRESLDGRLHLLEEKILLRLGEPIRYAAPLEARPPVLLQSVKEQQFEEVAKRRDSRYEPGERSGAWMKMRVNRGEEFVIGGYTVGTKTFDAVVSALTKANYLLVARALSQFTTTFKTGSSVPSMWFIRKRRLFAVGV
jgi:ATP-dependent DNA ligase